MRKSSLPLLVLLAATAFVPAACGSKTPAAPTSTVDAGFGTGATDGGALDGSLEGGPVGSASAAPSGSASASGMLVAGADGALDLAIQAQATKDAPGMTSEGQVGRATLQQGEHFGMVVTLQPGRCYTVVAMSAPLQVSELEVKLLMLPLNIESGRSAPTDKNPAVLGKGKNATCPISLIAVPYKVDVTAKKGAGRIAVAVFSKSK